MKRGHAFLFIAFLGAGSAIGCSVAEDATTEVGAEDEVSDARYELPRSSPLRKRVEEVNARWQKEITSEGRAAVVALGLRRRDEASIAATAKQLLFARAEEENAEWNALTINGRKDEPGFTAFQGRLADDVYDIAVKGVAHEIATEAFSQLDGDAAKLEDIRSIVGILGDRADVAWARIQGDLLIASLAGNRPANDPLAWQTTVLLLVNTKTGNAVELFAREGCQRDPAIPARRRCPEK